MFESLNLEIMNTCFKFKGHRTMTIQKYFKTAYFPGPFLVFKTYQYPGTTSVLIKVRERSCLRM